MLFSGMEETTFGTEVAVDGLGAAGAKKSKKQIRLPRARRERRAPPIDERPKPLLVVHIDAVSSVAFGSELFRWLWVADFVVVEINQRNYFAVLHFAFTKVVQVRLPMPVLGEIFSDAL